MCVSNVFAVLTNIIAAIYFCNALSFAYFLLNISAFFRAAGGLSHESMLLIDSSEDVAVLGGREAPAG